MPSLLAEEVERIAVSWRTGTHAVDGWTSPAGPLFVGGGFAEADIAEAGAGNPNSLCSACSLSCLYGTKIPVNCC
jgi:hypothetical protein